jgi:hypothetical protein|tara:strand:- start:801 stop:968 length:168 start_codon:yes stop_codon:yes gene_type:complete
MENANEWYREYLEGEEEYMFHTIKHYGKGYIAYNVLADLVRDGWHPPEKADNTNL